MTTTPLTQEALTRLARDKGRANVRRAWRDAKEAGAETRTRTGNAAVRQVVDGLMDLLADDLEMIQAGRSLPFANSLKHLRGAPIADICLAVARAAINGMMKPEMVPGISLQSKLGAAAEDALLDAKWRKLDPYQAEAVRAIVGHANNPHKKRMARKAYLMGWANELLAHGSGWDERTTKNVGAAFTQYLVKLGMLEYQQARTGKRAGPRKLTNVVCLTERAAQWISNAHEFDAASAEVAYPTIDPPIPWTAPFGGGPRGRGEIDHPAIPTNQRPLWIVRNVRREHKALLLKADLSTVYAALNAAQATGWRINRRVLDVFEELRRIGKGQAGLAVADKAEKPERPAEADTNEAVHKAFLADRREYHANERRMASKRRTEHRIFDTAQLFKSADRFHFAHTLDFRGRAYARSTFLSPQGRDLERGLLEFADGDPITPDGEWWLKVHLANTYGLDKESFEARIKWAEENSEWFGRIAREPLDHVREWEAADSPWQFLAACIAWADYKAGVPLCHLPVTVDGSCSGIQHSAALVLDADAGARVNLVPRGAHEKPSDIYADVAARAMEILAERAAALDRYAFGWVREWKVTRADTKSSVMTLPYGGTRFANVVKVRQSVEAQLRRGKKVRPPWLSLAKENREARSAAFRVLSEAIWQAMEEIIRAPMEVMAYFKDCARALRERERELQRDTGAEGDKGPHLRFEWTSPCGFPVLADYRKCMNRRTEIKDPESGRRMTFVYYATSPATDWEEVTQAAPPNFIHSLDASHLIRVLARCGALGLDKVAVVHDAFATTPSKMPALVGLLGEEFVEIYSGDVLGETLGRMLDDAGARRPEKMPAKGALDLRAIAQSRYMFA